MEGTVIDGRYRILRSIGAGGMAEVYEAEHIDLRRNVALKLVNQKKATAADKLDLWLARFEREARAVGATNTPHVAQVFDAGRDPERDVPYMAIELLRGDDLRALLKRLGALAPDAAFRIAAQACRGLVQAHAAGVVHRDIKPGNLFLHQDGDGQVIVKLLDFGVAKLVAEPLVSPDSAELTQTGSMLGTPQYMSPEQVLASANVDFRTDLWSLGVVLYKMLTGETPFKHANSVGQAVLAICKERFTPVERRAPWLSPAQAAVVSGALQRDPDARFPSAEAMLNALLAVTGGSDTLHPADLIAATQVPIEDAQPEARGPGSGSGILRGADDAPTEATAVAVRGVEQSHEAASHAKRGRLAFVVTLAALLGGGGLLYALPRAPKNLDASTLRSIRLDRWQKPAPVAPAAPATDTAPSDPPAQAPARPAAPASPQAHPEATARAEPPAPPGPKPKIGLSPEFE